MSGQKWPAARWLVRREESAANVARAAVTATGGPVVGLATRDALSTLGERQALALGRWVGHQVGDLALRTNGQETVATTSAEAGK